ncbi:MAG: prepilin-type N-terminal cleavage/methylation domain-containing protein [Verrucomicrobia bacterium]|nr:prepilin-type N-terminal cleavage/methylation domain-containing protein [Verrucomicrobiota bacterium]
MITSHHRQQGFSLVEVVIAASLLVVVVTMAMASFMYVISRNNHSFIQNELDIDVQVSMERIKRDLRLSTLDKMFFYPDGAGPYIAMSFPLARDDDGDGAVELDGNTNIIWDQTLIYHAWSGSPNQLRLTTFDPRNGNLTDSERQAQVDSVAAVGNGSMTHNGSNATTIVVFENLFTWNVTPQAAPYDAYADSLSRDIDAVLGSIVLDSGAHTLEFKVIDKNAASTGYKIGLDTIRASQSHSEREAEEQLPVTAQSGATAVNQYMSGGSWNGNRQLYFPAAAIGDYFRITLDNDAWEESNFRALGETHENTTVSFDTLISPSDFVVLLDGMSTNWLATEQTGATNGYSTAVDDLTGAAIRVILRGNEMPNGNWISSSGKKCKVLFKAGSGDLYIEHAYIATCSNSESNTMDAVTGSEVRLTFSGANSANIAAGTHLWSDVVAFAIDEEQSYLVSYLVRSTAGGGTAWEWPQTITPTEFDRYVIPAASAPDEAAMKAATWSARGDVASYSGIQGVEALFITYPTNGVYTSTIFDTAQSSPAYDSLSWSEVAPFGTDIRIRVRTGASNDLSDAAAWNSITPLTVPGSINPGDNRYVQFQAILDTDSSSTLTPKLRNVHIDWPGEERFVSVGGTMTKGPDYGVFQITVDGKSLKSAVVVNLEIFEYIRSHGSSNLITSHLSAEITPRNSGK